MTMTDHDPMYARLREEFHGGDDEELWALAARRAAADVERLFDAERSPRHVLLTIARVRGKNPGLHPDDHATFQLSWERSRGDAGWTFVGAHPRVQRRRGSYTATLCIPAGTVRLAYLDLVVLWRPRLPWAGPEDTEMGRQVYRFRREPDSTWRLLGGGPSRASVSLPKRRD